MSNTASMIFLHNYRTGFASTWNYHCSILSESIQGVVFIFFPKESMAKGININIYHGDMCVYDRPKFIAGLTVYGLDSDHTYPRALDKEDRIRNERIKNKRMIL
jgi:hypothetical protein